MNSETVDEGAMNLATTAMSRELAAPRRTRDASWWGQDFVECIEQARSDSIGEVRKMARGKNRSQWRCMPTTRVFGSVVLTL